MATAGPPASMGRPALAANAVSGPRGADSNVPGPQGAAGARGPTGARQVHPVRRITRAAGRTGPAGQSGEPGPRSTRPHLSGRFSPQMTDVRTRQGGHVTAVLCMR